MVRPEERGRPGEETYTEVLRRVVLLCHLVLGSFPTMPRGSLASEFRIPAGYHARSLFRNVSGYPPLGQDNHALNVENRRGMLSATSLNFRRVHTPQISKLYDRGSKHQHLTHPGFCPLHASSLCFGRLANLNVALWCLSRI